MKRLLLLFVIINTSFGIIWAQVPNNFRYQAVVRNGSGEIVADKVVSLRISILQGSAVGQTVYSEIFDYATNRFGIVALNIGSGSTVSGDFSTIEWGSNSFYLQVEIDIEGGSNYQFMGTSQILAVPYALHALDVTNKDDADADPNNEIQTLTKNGNTITLSGGGSVTDEINDADADITNEIQDLYLDASNNILRITNNPSATPISLSAYQGTNTDEQILSTNIAGNIVELTIGGGTGGNSVNIELPDDFVSRQNGGTFTGSVFAANLSGTNTGDMSNADVVNAYQAGFTDYFTTADRFKLDGIENNASADMTNVEIVSAYQIGYPGFFSSTDRTKMNSIESGATADMTNNEIVAAYDAGFPEHFDTQDRTKIDRLSLANNFTISGGHTVQFNSQGTTILTIPVSGTLATQSYVTNNSLTNDLNYGRILVGDNTNQVSDLDVSQNGFILIGNGNTIQSRAIVGDATLTNNGQITVNSIGGQNISLQNGSFTTTTDNITLRANAAGSDVTLPVSGALSTENYVTDRITTNNSSYTGSNTINTVGTVISGTWNATQITGAYLDLSSPGAIGATVANTGAFTSLSANSFTLGGHVFSVGGDVTFDDAFSVIINSTANTVLTLPTTGVLANQAYVNTQISNNNGSGDITSVGVVTSGTWNATPITANYLDLSSPGAIGSTTANTGAFTNLSATTGTFANLNIGGNVVNFAGNFTTTTGSVTLVANAAGSNLTLPQSGVLATEAYVGNNTGTNITSVGVITTGTWNASQITGAYLDLSSPGAIGSTVSNTGTFTILDATTGTFANLNVGANVIGLGGNFSTTTGNVTLVANAAGSNVTLPQSGTIATETYVNNNTGTNITSVGVITTGTWNASQITGAYLDLSSPGAIGTTAANTGAFTTLGAATGSFINLNVGSNSISLGGNLSTTTGNVTLVANGLGSNVTLPQSGTIATETYVNNNTGTNITSVGVITTGTWNASQITGAYLDLSSPGAIGMTAANTGTFTTLDAATGTFANLNVGANVISLGGNLSTTTGAVMLVADATGSNVTLPQTGALANQTYVNDRTGANITTVGIIGTGTWQADNIDNAYINWDAPGAIGTVTPNAASFTSLSASGTTTFTGTVNISNVLNLTPMATAPASPNEGDLYVNSTDNNIYCYINAGWRQLNN